MASRGPGLRSPRDLLDRLPAHHPEIRRRLADHQTFRWPAWFISVVQGSSDEYFATQKRFDAGKPVPGAWRIYYESTASGDYNAGRTTCSPPTATATTTSPTPTPLRAC